MILYHTLNASLDLLSPRLAFAQGLVAQQHRAPRHAQLPRLQRRLADRHRRAERHGAAQQPQVERERPGAAELRGVAEEGEPQRQKAEK